ncbi:MFS transporter [Dasania marina]|uniref:MFS transporter n=1 Tax=Dasania marina TaxID=471499 RepID=UPI000380D2AA|nr:MFS transporter [Dasania marina]
MSINAFENKTLSSEIDINSVKTVSSLACVGAIGAAVILLLPIIVGALVDHLSMTEQLAGIIVAIDMAGYTLATLTALLWIHRSNWRKITLLSLLVMLFGNVLSVFISEFEWLAIVRFITGIAAGAVTAVVVSAMGKTSNPDRSFGLWIVGQLFLGAFGFAFLPSFVEFYGPAAIFSLLAVLLLIALPLTFFIPLSAADEINNNSQPVNKTTKTKKIFVYLGVLSILTSYAGLTAVWSYVERIAVGAGYSSELIGQSLSIASIAGIVGGLGATILGAKIGRIIPISIALASAVVGIVVLKFEFSHVLYTLSACLFLFGWNFMLPFFMGSIAAVDSSSRIVALANAAIGIGLMVGPGLGGMLLTESSYSLLTSVGIFLIIISLILITPLALISHGKYDFMKSLGRS